MVRDKELAEVIAAMNRHEAEVALANHLAAKAKEKAYHAVIAGNVSVSGQIPQYKDNPNGFVEGSDAAVVSHINGIASKKYGQTIKKYFVLKVEKGERARMTVSSPGLFAIWIPEDQEQYCVEVAYRNASKVIACDYISGQSIAFFDGHGVADITLVVEVTRAQNIQGK